MLAGAHIKSGVYPEGKGVTQVNMRTIEAMHWAAKLGSAAAQCCRSRHR